MSMSAVGLQTHIWNNKLKSGVLLAGYPVLLALLLWGFHFCMAVANQQSALSAPAALGSFDLSQIWHTSLTDLSQTWPIAAIVTIVWFTIAWFFHQSMINKATGAKPLERMESPAIYNLLENLCISRGLPMPKLYVIESPALNAYASGINTKTYAVTVTRGLLQTLNKEELEAVLGHELTHIMNRDVQLLIISVIFVGMISFFAEIAWRSLTRGGTRIRSGGNRKGAGGALLIAAIILAIGYALALVIRFTLSRKREFLADAGAVELTKNPDAMISALQKISGHAKLEDVPGEVEQMFIENPPGFFGMFATHPPIDKRIEALSQYAGGRVAPHTLNPSAQSSKSPWGTT